MVIEAWIEHINFIGGGARFWVGPLAESSALIMKVRYIDIALGKIIAEPEFFQRAAAWSGAFNVGGQDNAMLARISTIGRIVRATTLAGCIFIISSNFAGCSTGRSTGLAPAFSRESL